MTANQLSFQRNIEEKRHNEAMERLQQASINVSDKQAQASLTSAGAAAMQAQIAGARASEEERHNRAMEKYNMNKMYVDAAGTAIDAAKVAATFMS